MSGCGKVLTNGFKRSWLLVDASGHNLGRLSTQICSLLMGKNKPIYSPQDDNCGDYVVVINANQIEYNDFTRTKKVYYWHTGYPGGLKQRTLKEMQISHPEKILEKAVYGMLPDNKLRKGRMERLKIYLNDEHPHLAQLPQGTVPTITSQYPKKDHHEWIVLSDESPEIPEDWGRVLQEFSTFEPGYKNPFDIDFRKLHEEYLDAHPHEREKEEKLYAELDEMKKMAESFIKENPELAKKLLTPRSKKSKH